MRSFTTLLTDRLRAIYRELLSQPQEKGMQTAADYAVVQRGCGVARSDNPFDGKHYEYASEWHAWAWDMGWREAEFVGQIRGAR